MSLAVQTLKNTLFSAIGYIVPMFFSFVVTPLLVRDLGVGAYGVYVFIATWTGFLLLADLGLGMSLMKSVSESSAVGDKERLQKVVSVAVFVFGLFAVVGFLVFAVLSMFAEKWFGSLGISSHGLRLAFILGGLGFTVASLNQLFIALIRGLNRFDIVVRNSLLQLISFNSIVLLLMFTGHLGLLWVLAANLATSALTLILLIKGFWKEQPHTKMRPRFYKEEVVRMYKFGMAAFVTNLSNNTLTQLDRIIIPFMVGAGQLSFYSLPGNIAEKINGTSGSLAGVFFPYVSMLDAMGDRHKVSKVFRQVMRVVGLFTFALAVVVGAMRFELLKYWVGEEFAVAGSTVLLLLAFTNFGLALYTILSNILLGLGRVRFLMTLAFIMAVLNVILLFILVPYYGIVGAAWAYILSLIPVVYGFWYAEKKVFQSTGNFKFYNLFVGRLVVVGSFVWLFLEALRGQVHSILMALIVSGVGGLLFVALYWIFGFVEKEDEDVLRKFFISIFSRILKR